MACRSELKNYGYIDNWNFGHIHLLNTDVKIRENCTCKNQKIYLELIKKTKYWYLVNK
jgi:hypothetical protein